MSRWFEILQMQMSPSVARYGADRQHRVRSEAREPEEEKTHEYINELLHTEREDALTPRLNLRVIDRVPQAALLGESEEGVHLFRSTVVGGHATAAEEVRLGAFVAEEEQRRGERSDELVCRGAGVSAVLCHVSQGVTDT